MLTARAKKRHLLKMPLYVLFGEEFHLDGGMEHSLFQTSWNETAVAYSLTILFCSHYDRSRIIVSSIPDRMHV